MQSRTPKIPCCKHGGSQHERSCLSGLSVDEFQDLPIQFGQVLKAKGFNRCGIFACRTVWPDAYEKKKKPIN